MSYTEPGRSWAGFWVTVVLLAAGFALDRSHLLGWVLALIIVGGAVALITRAARTARSIVVTDIEVRAGERSIPRAEIASCRPGIDRAAALWGQGAALGGAETLTRDATGVTLTRTDGTTLVLPCREPARLAAALGWPAR